jgi:hypothetical protein
VRIKDSRRSVGTIYDPRELGCGVRLRRAPATAVRRTASARVRESEGMRASLGRERELSPVPFIGRGEEREREGRREGSNGAGGFKRHQWRPSMGENVGEGEEESAALVFSLGGGQARVRTSRGRAWCRWRQRGREKRRGTAGGPRL